MSTAIETPNRTFPEHLPLILAVLFFIVCLFTISPAGNFPLNDDYVYNKAVDHFLQTGRIELYASSSSCYLHILIGALVSSLFGSSFEIHRYTTLVVSFFSVIVFYLFLKELDIDRALAGLGTLIYVTNPLIINLQYSFMTDIAAVTFSLASQLFCLKAIKKNSKVFFVLAGTMLMAAILIRHSSAIWVAANLLILTCLYFKKRFSFTALIMLVILPVMLAIGCDRYMEATCSMLDAYHCHKERAHNLLSLVFSYPRPLGQLMLMRAGHIVVYLAIFALPLIPAFYKPGLYRRLFSSPSLMHVLWCLIGLSAITSSTLYGFRMPFLCNLWQIHHLGSRSIMGAHESFHTPFFLAATSIALMLAFALLPVLAAACQKAVTSVKLLFAENQENCGSDNTLLGQVYCASLFIVGFAYCTFHLAVRPFDRYLVDLLPVALAFLCLATIWLKTRPAMIPAVMMALCLGIV
ncbi:MAG: glycosyltransferase family 39 protein, partial [Candidatus Obscuribacterales bacterium]|nr:glycosyltransferase family 39 protein [Candidatus Obscuribacterales bacterium]